MNTDCTDVYLKIGYPSGDKFAEAIYYFQAETGNVHHTLAMISMYLFPDQTYLAMSCNTLVVCQKPQEIEYRVIKVNLITAVVAMPPLPLTVSELEENDDLEDLFYVAEKPGLDMFHLSGEQDDNKE